MDIDPCIFFTNIRFDPMPLGDAKNKEKGGGVATSGRMYQCWRKCGSRALANSKSRMPTLTRQASLRSIQHTFSITTPMRSSMLVFAPAAVSDVDAREGSFLQQDR